jgi:hypothetical protein
MAIQQGNPSIIKNGLQLYYNREYNKSYRGESVTNLAGTVCAKNEGGGAGVYWSGTSAPTTDTSTGYKAIKVFPVPGGYQYSPGAWTSTGIIAGGGGYQPPGTYSLSAKVLLPKNSTYVYGFRYYPGGEELSLIVTGSGTWQTIKRQNFTVTGYNYLQFQMVQYLNGNTAGASPIYSGDSFWVRDVIINSGSYSKPFAGMSTAELSDRPENTTNITNNANFALPITGASSGGTQNGWTFASWSGTGNSYVTQGSTVLYYYSEGYYSVIPLRVTRAVAGSMDFFSTAWSTLSNGTTYTISFWARASTDTVTLDIVHQNLGTIKSYAVYSGWYKFTATFTHAGGTQYPYLRHAGSNGTWIEIANVQLEAKSCPTDFTNTSRSNIANTVANGGGLLDVSGNGYSSDLNSSAITFDGNGFYFIGNNSGALTTPIANSVLDGLSNNTHTYEVWVKLLGTPPGLYDGYFFGRQGFHEGFAHYKATPATIFIITWYHDNTATGLTYPASLNTWYHGVYAVNVENATRKLYINGSLVDSGTLTKQLKQYTSPYYLGAAGTEYAGNCIVSSAKAYNRELSVAEISQNFNASRTTYGI